MTWTREQLEQRLVRYADLAPCKNAFVDTRTPGSDQKENFSIIGPGVSENPDQHVHLPIPHGFSVGAARQPFGCTNSQHSHETAEVFVVHTGHWRLPFGTEKQDGHIDVAPGDVVSVPTRMFRGFNKLDEGTGFLYVVLGLDDPGKVTWAPSVFKMAEHYGLKLLKGGKLIDTTVGQTVPAGAELEVPPTLSQIAALATPPPEALLKQRLRLAEMTGNVSSPLAGVGVQECGVISLKDSGDGFKTGPISGTWPHGFALRCLKMLTGARIPSHVRDEAEVIFVHEGALEFTWPGGSLVLCAGDTLSVPIGLERAYRNPSSQPLVAFVTRGTDTPAMPRFVARKAA